MRLDPRNAPHPHPEPSRANKHTRRLRPPRAATGLRALGAVAGGLTVYGSAPPHHLWWLAPLGVALLAAALHHRRTRGGFGYGFLFGLAYLLPLLSWLYDTVGEEFGVWPWFGVVTIEALFFGLAGAGMARVSRLPGSPVWMAAVLVTTEFLRSHVPYGGFPWGRLAFTQPEGAFVPLASLGGATLVTFGMMLTGCGLAVLARHLLHRPRAHLRAVTSAGTVTALPLVVGVTTMPTLDTAPTAGTVTVAVVQGDAPNIGIDLMGKNELLRANHIQQVTKLVQRVRSGRLPRPDLVLFPESSNVWGLARSDPTLDRIANQLGVPLAVGGIAHEVGGRISNRVILWEPGRGATEEYAKQHLVPFSETIPLRELASAVTPFVKQFSRDMTPGTTPGLFDMDTTRVGFAICYEVAYDSVLTETVRGGAELLAVPTNNAWFGRSEMTYQQLAMARLRAVEHSRSVVVASTSGVSAIIRPDGTVIEQSRQYTADLLIQQVPLRSTTTLATRLGTLPTWILTALGIGALLATLRTSYRGRPPTARTPPRRPAGRPQSPEHTAAHAVSNSRQTCSTRHHSSQRFEYHRPA
ncbi:apolipoprotein N-acyltransferase [Actinopolyspora halophila]|uniref:apolipoprotein N-acyltransferase n=1 Tax=Actinopolyspora halophila TaxID=1850 RepID=UPI0003739008|nr:apolipoprotein N-acyltransferase [Actinopolyspora halophila]